MNEVSQRLLASAVQRWAGSSAVQRSVGPRQTPPPPTHILVVLYQLSSWAHAAARGVSCSSSRRTGSSTALASRPVRRAMAWCPRLTARLAAFAVAAICGGDLDPKRMLEAMLQAESPVLYEAYRACGPR